MDEQVHKYEHENKLESSLSRKYDTLRAISNYNGFSIFIKCFQCPRDTFDGSHEA